MRCPFSFPPRWRYRSTSRVTCETTPLRSLHGKLRRSKGADIPLFREGSKIPRKSERRNRLGAGPGASLYRYGRRVEVVLLVAVLLVAVVPVSDGGSRSAVT